MGCGSSGGSASSAPKDGGASSSGSGGSSGGSGSGDDASGGDDATTGDDTGTSSSGGGPIDATLDMGFPDAFYGPDAGSSSGGKDAGTDGPQCFPDGVTCQGSTAYACSGGVLTTTGCGSNQCVNGYGCIVCMPGTGSCNGTVGTSCNPLGNGYATTNCDPQLGETCEPSTGQCLGDCANVGTSYIGCEYYAVTMSNEQLDQTTFSFSVSTRTPRRRPRS